MIKQHNPCLSVVWLCLVIFCTLGCASTKSTNDSSELELTGAVVSCGHMSIYQLSEDNKSYIQFIINTKKIDLLQDNSWNLADVNENITVRYRSFDESIASKLCNDIGGRRLKPVKEIEAGTGMVNLKLTEAEWQNYKQGRRYKVDLSATGLNLLNDKNYSVSIDQAAVGWLPG